MQTSPVLDDGTSMMFSSVQFWQQALAHTIRPLLEALQRMRRECGCVIWCVHLVQSIDYKSRSSVNPCLTLALIRLVATNASRRVFVAMKERERYIILYIMAIGSTRPMCIDANLMLFFFFFFLGLEF